MISVARLPLLSLLARVYMCIVLCYPLHSGPSSSNRLMKQSDREVGYVGLQEEREREGLRDFVPVITLPGMSHCFFECPNPSMHADNLPHLSAHLALLA